VVASGASTDLQCGRKFSEDDPQDVPGGVTYTIEPCPDDGLYAGQTCLHIKLTATASISDIHLAILDGDGDPSSLPNGLGNWPHNSYCSFSGNQGDCWVPESVVLAVLDPPSTSLCNQDIIIAVGISITGATCFARGTVIDSTGRWFMYTTAGFTCPDVCTKSCCCPPPPDKPPKKCGSETAFASAAGKTFNLADLGCTKAWGYYQKLTATEVNSLPVGSTVYTADLLAGKTQDVGEVTVTKKSSTCFSVTLDAAAGFGIGKTHIDISCSDPKTNLGDRCRTPGKYEFNSGCIDEDPYTTTRDVCVENVCSNFYYFIIHAETYNVIEYNPANPEPYDKCSPYTCSE